MGLFKRKDAAKSMQRFEPNVAYTLPFVRCEPFANGNKKGVRVHLQNTIIEYTRQEKISGWCGYDYFCEVLIDNRVVFLYYKSILAKNDINGWRVFEIKKSTYDRIKAGKSDFDVPYLREIGVIPFNIKDIYNAYIALAIMQNKNVMSDTTFEKVWMEDM